jgi:hypothetical protein
LNDDESSAGAPRSQPRATGPSGVGLGLRWDFLEELLARPDAELGFLEVSPENYMRRGGYYPAALERLGERWPIVTHGLTLSIGAADPPDRAYLRELRAEVTRLRVPWHSDHLCFSTAGPLVLHDLLPVKQCRESVERIVDRARALEDQLGVPFALENISWYAASGRPELPEAEMIAEIVERSGCGLLLDVNNVWVNSHNHGFDPRGFIRSLPLERVVEIHVAGHTPRPDGLVIDTHGTPVADPVHELLAWTLERTGPVPVLLERDNDVPPLDELLAELARLRHTVRCGLGAWEERHASRARAGVR